MHCASNCLDVLILSAFDRRDGSSLVVSGDARRLAHSDLGFYRTRFDALLNV
jgi:hypothetical protein